MTTIEISDYIAERLEKAAEIVDEPVSTIIEWLVEENLDAIVEEYEQFN